MKKNVFNLLGVGLFLLCAAASLIRVAATEKSDSPDGSQITLRFAHWQLEDGPRDAFTKLAAEYTRLHPNVRVIPIAIPERIYPNWLLTQLIGETAPDLIQIGIGLNSERIARFFTPLTDLANAPNPYNRGTDLEAVPLRDTFFDGMEAGYNSSLFQYYGAPISGFSVRMFYNLDLLKEITGDARLPESYEELRALCDRALEYQPAGGGRVTPIASSKYNGPILMRRLFSSQTQTLSERLNPVGVIGSDVLRRADDYLHGRWSLQSEEIRSGFDLMRDVGQFMQPGFLQLGRDDATLLFVQKRALMICTGSWDATSIRNQAAFRVGVGQIPFPTRETPRFGRHTLGALSEAGSNGGIIFGITRQSRHAKAATDFLHFLTSQRGNRLWSDTSGWLPSVVGIKVSPEVAPFLPSSGGQLPGLTIDSGGMPDTARVYNSSLHQLFGPSGGSASFVSLLDPSFSNALRADLRRQIQTSLDIVQQGDTRLGALARLAARPGENTNARRRVEEWMEAASANERRYLKTRLLLRTAEKHDP